MLEEKGEWKGVFNSDRYYCDFGKNKVGRGHGAQLKGKSGASLLVFLVRPCGGLVVYLFIRSFSHNAQERKRKKS